jgi:hypothetical protein
MIMWRLWAKALGEKHGRTDAEADQIALIRTCILVTYIVTNLFIVAGVIRHWNSDEKSAGIQVDHGHYVFSCSPDPKQQPKLE